MDVPISVLAGGPPRIVDLEVFRQVLSRVLAMLDYLASIIQYNLFSCVPPEISFVSLLLALQPRPDLRDLRSVLISHIAHPPPHTTSLYVHLLGPLADSSFLVRLHHFETVSTHSIPIKFLKHRSAVPIGLVDPGQGAVHFPPYQILFMYPTVTGLACR